MKLTVHNYVPCLRWKMGEYQALSRLSPPARQAIIPLLDIAEIGFDFETRQESKSVDEHLFKVAKRIREKWGPGECVVDMHHIDRALRMADGSHPVSFIFGDLREKGVHAIPAIGLDADLRWQDAVRRTVQQDGRGLCLRVPLVRAAARGAADAILGLAKQLESQVEEIDLVIDEESPNFEPAEGFVGLLEATVKRLPVLDRWRSFVVLGSSLPQSLGAYGAGMSHIPRLEWLTYKLLVRRMRAAGIRVPVFGDYAINHPEVSQIDPRLMTPAANIRYTVDDGWLIVRGRKIRDYGLAQHRDLCNMLVMSSGYSGPSYSQGDKYIYDCSRGNESTGNLSTWRWVGTNHHLEKVVKDLANFSAS